VSSRVKRILTSVLFTLAVVGLIGLCEAPLPIWTPAPTPTPEPTPTPQASLTVCSSGCSFATLQEAIDEAQSGDIIGVLDAVHTEAGIVVDKDVTILGQSPSGAVVQAHAEPGEATESVFIIAEGATVVIKDLTIRHGNPETGMEAGGGINNRGVVTLERCVITENAASAGGGVNSFGSMTLIDSAVSNNVANGTGEGYTGCGTGGGIKVEQGPLVVINSVINGNKSKGNGGGIFLACKGTLELTNSTISGNEAVGGSGGGVCIRGAAKLTQSTIANNRAAQTGGGIYVRGSGESGLVRGWLDFSNTIVVGNTTGSEYCCADCMLGEHSTMGVNVNNLVEDGSCNPAFTGSPLLQPLADNGGQTLTHALLRDSPAIDAIPIISCTVSVDQRGKARSMEIRSSDTPCDIGAFELQPGEE
jgi:hypothetical protein